MPKKRKSKSKQKPSLLKIVVLMIVALFLCGFTYRLFFGPAANDAQAIKVADLKKAVAHRDILNSNDPAECLEYIEKQTALLKTKKAADLAKSTLIQTQCFEAAARLIEISQTEEQQTAGIKHQLAAARGLVALQYADKNNLDRTAIQQLGHNARLTKLAKKYRNHPNEVIRRQADSGLLLIDVYGYTNSLFDRNITPEKQRELLATAKQTFIQTLDRYRDDNSLLRPMRMAFSHWAKSAPDTAGDLVEELHNRFPPQGDKTLDLFVQNLADLHLLQTLGFENKIKDKELETKGRKPLRDAAIAILKSKRFGNRALLAATVTTDWYECQNDLDSSFKIYTAMKAASLQNEGLAPREKLRDFARLGLERIAMQGKKVTIEATSLTGVRISNDLLKNKIVVLIFWSGREDRSMKIISQLYAQRAQIEQNHVEVLPISLVDQVEAKAFVKKCPDWNFLTRSKAGFDDQFSATTVPHIMVLDHEHNVLRVRANLDNLDDVVKEAIQNRRAAITPNDEEPAEEADSKGEGNGV